MGYSDPLNYHLVDPSVRVQVSYTTQLIKFLHKFKFMFAQVSSKNFTTKESE